MKLYETRYLYGREKRAEWRGTEKEDYPFTIIDAGGGYDVDVICLTRTEARKLALFILDKLGD